MAHCGHDDYLGTQISVEDLFYNVPHRRRALKNANDELNRIADVLQRWVFACKQAYDAWFLLASKLNVARTHWVLVATLYTTRASA